MNNEDLILFLVRRRGHDIENAIVWAIGREDAKGEARVILGGNPDDYIVEPITRRGAKTVVVLNTR